MPTLECQRPTRARYWVVVFAVALAIIQPVDRVCISKAMPSIKRELGFSSRAGRPRVDRLSAAAHGRSRPAVPAPR
jgi:hypothetical protein